MRMRRGFVGHSTAFRSGQLHARSELQLHQSPGQYARNLATEPVRPRKRSRNFRSERIPPAIGRLPIDAERLLVHVLHLRPSPSGSFSELNETLHQQSLSPLGNTDPAHRVAAIFSPGIRRIRWLREFLDFDEIVFRPGAQQAAKIDVVLTWGNKETGRTARDFANKHGKPLWRLEDGFFRSIHPGARFPSASLVLDTQGIYYDARVPSDLETLLES